MNPEGIEQYSLWFQPQDIYGKMIRPVGTEYALPLQGKTNFGIQYLWLKPFYHEHIAYNIVFYN
jgi:hypothetical protein